MNKCLKMSRDEILKEIDLSVQRKYLWISNVKASKNVQWSMTYNGSSRKMRFGINIESANVARKIFTIKLQTKY